MKFLTPLSLDSSIMVFSAGIKTSHPSNPNLFSLVHLLARNSSNLKRRQIHVVKKTGKYMYIINVYTILLIYTMYNVQYSYNTVAIIYCICHYLVALTSLANSILFSLVLISVTPGFSNLSLIQLPSIIIITKYIGTVYTCN